MVNCKIVTDSSSDMITLNNIPFSVAPLKIVTAEKEYTDNSSLDVGGMVNDLLKYKANHLPLAQTPKTG